MRLALHHDRCLFVASGRRRSGIRRRRSGDRGRADAGGCRAGLACTNSLTIATRFPTHLAATPTGLWASDHDIDPSKLVAADRVLAEPPVRAMKDQLFAEAGATQWVSYHDDLWCFGDNSAGMGQVSAWTLCVRDGELVGASREETSSQDFSA